ncbi:iron(III) transport system substrate-binding protein [Arthrobacter sp. OV608]|nr:iron(III) transport system substrate-binding protein [Arthrobacter sp. OV608]
MEAIAVKKTRAVMAHGCLLVAGGLLALTGCASAGAGSSTSNSGANPADVSNKIMDQAEWSKVVDAANKEGELTIYGLLSPSMSDPLPAAFQKDYPNIKLTYVRSTPADITARVDAELAAGNVGADVVDILDHPTFDAYANKGALLPLTVPALGDPKVDRAKNQRTPYVVTMGSAVYAWAWNTKLMPQGINSWQDLLNVDPSHLGVTDPSIGPTVASVLQTTEKPQTGGSAFLDKLTSKGAPRSYPGSNPQIAAMAAGEISATMPVPAGNVASVKATGAPVDYKVYPNAGSIRNEVVVLKAGKHPNAAQVYVNWLLGEAGQTIIAKGMYAVREGVSGLIQTNGVTLEEIPQITTDEAKAFQQRWKKLLGQ